MAPPLVRAADLAGLLDTPDVVIADVRWYLDGRSGRAAYDAGHITGAVFVDVDTALAGPPGSGPGRHPLPVPTAFAAAMAELGIGESDRVVAYDDAGGSIAARLWWMGTALGRQVAVLDGGMQAWEGPLETGPGQPRPAAGAWAVPDTWPAAALVDAASLESDAPAAGLRVLLDARAAERYRGEVEPIDPRAGHIPGARNAPWSGNLDPATGRFLEPAQLRRRYLDLAGDEKAEVVAYCGSGITACHDLLAMEVAELPAGRLYAGSWSDWSSQPHRQVATGDQP